MSLCQDKLFKEEYKNRKERHKTTPTMKTLALLVYFSIVSANSLPDLQLAVPDRIVEDESRFDFGIHKYENVEGRIVNGNRATRGQFPYQAGLSIRDRQDRYFRCGGSVISNYWILTAAHCTYQ